MHCQWFTFSCHTTRLLLPAAPPLRYIAQVSHASGVHEKDARLQYLSWRVWGIKRKHAMVAQQRVLEAATEVEDSELSEVRSEEAGGPGPVPEEVSFLASSSAAAGIARRRGSA